MCVAKAPFDVRLVVVVIITDHMGNIELSRILLHSIHCFLAAAGGSGGCVWI